MQLICKNLESEAEQNKIKTATTTTIATSNKKTQQRQK